MQQASAWPNVATTQPNGLHRDVTRVIACGVPRAYRTVRDHLDDVIGFARCVFAQRTTTDPGRLAELQFEVADRLDQIEGSLELARSAMTPLPLDRLRKAFALEHEEMRSLYLLLGLAVSADVRAVAGTELGTLELIDHLLYANTSARDRFADHLANDGRLFGYGLIEFVDENRSRFARPVRISDRVIDLAFGRDRPTSELTGFASLSPAEPKDLLIPDDVRRDVRAALTRHAEHGAGVVPVLRGVTGSGRRALVSTIAHELGARVLVVHCGALPDRLGHALTTIMREAILAGAVIVLADAEHLAGDLSQGLRARTSAIDVAFAHYSGPLAITLAKDASPGALVPSRGVVVVDLPALTEAQRTTLWARHVPQALASEVAARYRISGGYIERAAQSLKEHAPQPTLSDVHAAVRSVVHDKLTTLGVRIEWKQNWAELVLPDDSSEELHEMVARVKHRRHVLDDWGFGAKIAKGLGVAALFCGPPGTGKTMAAGLVANELGLDLYQIDLSRMVSKYIGETEKNLAQVFDAAETGHAVLLFDEADSMFAKRTEVKNSVDRYANLEVNYLLQRMEAFTGITILTTNNDSAIDEAFRRRLAFSIRFPMPEEDERKRLWRALIPPQSLAPNVDFDKLAERFVMSGGYIKNAALRAAYLAANDGGLIEMKHLVKAAGAEYLSMGKVMPQGFASSLS